MFPWCETSIGSGREDLVIITKHGISFAFEFTVTQHDPVSRAFAWQSFDVPNMRKKDSKLHNATMREKKFFFVLVFCFIFPNHLRLLFFEHFYAMFGCTRRPLHRESDRITSWTSWECFFSFRPSNRDRLSIAFWWEKKSWKVFCLFRWSRRCDKDFYCEGFRMQGNVGWFSHIWNYREVFTRSLRSFSLYPLRMKFIKWLHSLTNPIKSS